MITAGSRGGQISRFNFWLLLAFIAMVFLMGGASRPDALSQPVIRIVSILALAVWAAQTSAEHLRSARAPCLFLGGAAALILIQLVPLPPTLWMALPGRQLFVEGMTLAGIEPNWRPLSLTPDRSLDSLLSLLPPIAAAAGLMVVERDRHHDIIVFLLVLILLSLLTAIAQISTGSLYLYQVTNEGSAVGIFANRNHQALLLALALPMLGYVLTRPEGDYRRLRVHYWLAGMYMVLIGPMILVTGSRAGIVLGVVGAMLALALSLWRTRSSGARPNRAALIAVIGSLTLSVVALAATVFLARDLALHRLVEDWGQDEQRAQNLDEYLRMAGDFMPLGSGAGSFDPIYRIYEPLEALDSTYLNHAHNDLAQIAIEFGVPGLALLGAFALWWALRSWRLWRHRNRADGIGRVGSALILLPLIASIGDYPLRTPIHSVVWIIAIFFLQRVTSAGPRGRLEPATASAKAQN